MEVKDGSFKEVEGFVNINPDLMYDDNDKPYAVLKVTTENINDKQRRELIFQGNAGTYIELEYHVGEVWVYLTAKYADYIKISHPDFGSIEFAFPFDLKGKKGYELTLINKAVDEDFQKRLDDIEAMLAGGNGSIGNYGYLVVHTTPEDGATVFIDGEEMGTRTPFVSDKLDAGKHRIRITKDLYKPYVSVVDVPKGETGELSVELKPNFGYITINSKPIGADVYIDEIHVGVTPYELKKIKLGQRTIELRKDGYMPTAEMVVINEGDHKKLESIKLKKATKSDIVKSASTNNNMNTQNKRSSASNNTPKVRKSRTNFSIGLTSQNIVFDDGSYSLSYEPNGVTKGLHVGLSFERGRNLGMEYLELGLDYYFFSKYSEGSLTANATSLNLYFSPIKILYQHRFTDYFAAYVATGPAADYRISGKVKYSDADVSGEEEFHYKSLYLYWDIKGGISYKSYKLSIGTSLRLNEVYDGGPMGSGKIGRPFYILFSFVL
ncbi:MAG: PEGA domain-containing protein [Bacteroidales bacterium]|nr:PEGA domain-containing protein [Bacteroidales bacterium]